MPGPNRGSLIAKMYKVLKQHYKPNSDSEMRPLLEQMLFACCLENASYEKADKIYNHLASSFFDWNEVRVSTVNELAEAMRDLPAPAAAAANLKRILQTVFETSYSFDLESVKKQNLGVGIKRLAKLEGTTPFVVGYATQHALGGHSIPLDRGSLEVLFIVGIATEAERQSGAVGGLERAIPKTRGAEFGSLLHQLAADFVSNPLSPTVKTVLLAINPAAKDRFPKRGQKRNILEPPTESANATKPSGKPLPGKVNAKSAPEMARPDKSGHEFGRSADRKAGPREEMKHSKASSTSKPSPTPASKKQLSKKEAAAKAVSKGKHPPGNKSTTKQLAKRKPR